MKTIRRILSAETKNIANDLSMVIVGHGRIIKSLYLSKRPKQNAVFVSLSARQLLRRRPDKNKAGPYRPAIVKHNAAECADKNVDKSKQYDSNDFCKTIKHMPVVKIDH